MSSLFLGIVIGAIGVEFLRLIGKRLYAMLDKSSEKW